MFRRIFNKMKIKSLNCLDFDIVAEYYFNELKDNEIMKNFFKDYKIMGIQLVPDPVIRKHYDNKDIKIIDFSLDNQNKKNNIYFYIKQHFVDFHIIYDEKVNIIPIDFDPHDSDHKKMLKYTLNIMKEDYDNIIVVDTGGRGNHVIALLDKFIDIDIAKDLADNISHEVVSKFDNAVDKAPKKGEVRIDISTFHSGGSLRIPGSINYKTCKPSKIIYTTK